jgi:hypothetical protein
VRAIDSIQRVKKQNRDCRLGQKQQLRRDVVNLAFPLAEASRTFFRPLVGPDKNLPTGYRRSKQWLYQQNSSLGAD